MPARARRAAARPRCCVSPPASRGRPAGGCSSTIREVAGPERFVPPEKRNVGLMFQDFALFPASHHSRQRRLRAEVAAARGRDARGRGGARARRPRALRRRLSAHPVRRRAAARGAGPRDRAAAVGDADGRAVLGPRRAAARALQEETLQLLRETRATCLIVTHAPAEAMRLGDRIAVMRGGSSGAGRQGRGALSQSGRSVRGAAVLRDQRDPVHRRGRRAAGRRSARSSCPISATATRRFCASAGGRSVLAAGGQGLPGRVLHVKFLGDQAVLEIAAQGFERPLMTLVREGEEPARGRGGRHRRRSGERAGVSSGSGREQ